ATSIIKTSGNPDCHLVLRGGRNGPNYQSEHIHAAAEKLRGAKQLAAMMVDCSHANSSKDYRNQPLVWENLMEQRREGRKEIVGAMLESNLHAGNQSLPKDLTQLKYGVSVTDGCIDWETTERILS
ncbi:MAG: 3-deoxy-7-phosphoheptulonate synthase, partial [Chthoniobacterales bacterium]